MIIDWVALMPAATLAMGAIGAALGWLARRPKDSADARAVEAQTEINIAKAVRETLGGIIAEQNAADERRKAEIVGLLVKIARLEADLSAEQEARRSMSVEMSVVVVRVGVLEKRLRDAGLNANGAH